MVLRNLMYEMQFPLEFNRVFPRTLTGSTGSSEIGGPQPKSGTCNSHVGCSLLCMEKGPSRGGSTQGITCPRNRNRWISRILPGILAPGTCDTDTLKHTWRLVLITAIALAKGQASEPPVCGRLAVSVFAGICEPNTKTRAWCSLEGKYLSLINCACCLDTYEIDVFWPLPPTLLLKKITLMILIWIFDTIP